jgi:hypothetical protein
MAKPLLATEQLAYCTVRIVAETPDGQTSVGTGFFFRFLDDGKTHVPAIVTNRHVVQGAAKARLHFNLANEAGDPVLGRHYSIGIENLPASWIPHPDLSVDLCVLPMAVAVEEMRSEGRRPFYRTLNFSLFPTDEELSDLGALEPVLMVGYPTGLWDSVNNLPILRRGVTATHPCIDYEGRPEFLIDAACFPGSSGSPVLLYNESGYLKRDGTMVMGGPRIRLLGMLRAGPQLTVEGEIVIINVPSHQVPVAQSRIPVNLGVVIKAHKLRDFDRVLLEAVSRDANA